MLRADEALLQTLKAKNKVIEYIEEAIKNAVKEGKCRTIINLYAFPRETIEYLEQLGYTIEPKIDYYNEQLIEGLYLISWED